MIFAQSNMKEFLYTPGMFFEIPEFQRPYSWQTANVDEFLSDLEECIGKGKNHYFGTVVQVKDTGRAYSRAIIDGQQRVTTSMLMVSAIFHMAKRNPSLIEDPDTTVEMIEYQYLVNRDMNNNRVKLRTVTTDNEVLQHIFDANGEVSQLEKDRQSNVYKVYAKFREYFSSKQKLDRYINGLENFEIAVLTLVAGDDSPQRVFESINSTGKPLEAVLAHELGHIKNRDMLVSTITATAAGAITLLADFAFWGGALFGGDEEDNWLGELALLLLAPIGATIIQLAVSRTREFGADQHAGHLLGHGDYLISALQKLESFKHEVGTAQFHPKDQATAHLMFQNMFSMHGIGKLFSTHPSTEDRIKKLQS